MRPTRSSMVSVPGSPTPYFTAFSHRFQTIWRSCDGSTWTSTSPSSEEMASRVGLDLHGRAELVAESREPVGEDQALGPRVLAARHRHDVFDDLPHAIAVGAHDLGQPLVFGGQRRRFAEQLRRVAHGADGIADLVRDARRQPAEARELRLLDLRGQQLRVFEEHDDRRGFRCRRARRNAAGSRGRRRRRRRSAQAAAGVAVRCRQVSSR